jgi:predicted nucleic acid-binding protein
VIYLDTSVVLAQLFAEDRRPPASLWRHLLISSRLLEYEVWTRVHARQLTQSHGEPAKALLERVAFVELAQPVLSRALTPFPSPVRTLDALHLASIEFLREKKQDITLASYDDRLITVARQMGIAIATL